VITYPADLEKYGFYAENEGNVLRIGTQAKHQFDTDAFRITVYADVSAYRLTGGLELHADAGNTAMSALSLTVSGGADCTIENIGADEVILQVDGAADISLSGNTAFLSGTINGAADMDCVSLHAHSAALTVNGAGAAAVSVSDRLDVEINGAGSVTYLGSPAVNKTIRGAGSVAPAGGSGSGDGSSIRQHRERQHAAV
ncbi:MAG: GIN domain-containing protein, partial [Eubacteriales bacterium]